jgi:hypothetical protein
MSAAVTLSRGAAAIVYELAGTTGFGACEVGARPLPGKEDWTGTFVLILRLVPNFRLGAAAAPGLDIMAPDLAAMDLAFSFSWSMEVACIMLSSTYSKIKAKALG